ncbi:TRAP transporter substrate-binding protein [Burkholderia territorii]|nr:TRAP transporter substrate-binding protein [Burkholderia territorii]
MNSKGRGGPRIGCCNFIALLTFCAPAFAGTTWEFATEYPENTMPGLGIATFQRLVNTYAGDALQIDAKYAAPIKSSGLIKAVHERRLQGGDAFAGSLGDVDPIFQLSSLPFVTQSIDDARRLACVARAEYAKVFERHGQHLLYVTPWPPTGLWTREPIASPHDFPALTVRTYDKISEAVMTTVGARAVNASFSEVMPRLENGSVNGILSSGDGDAGRRFWKFLPNFTAITYAVPLSFAIVDDSEYRKLPQALKDKVDAAAAETEREQWTRVETRVEKNFAQMRVNGIAIHAAPSPAVMELLRKAAAPSIAAWRENAGPDRERILERYQSDGRSVSYCAEAVFEASAQ